MGSAIFFVARDAATGQELWRTDGTEGGTTLVKDIRPGPSDGGVDSLTEMGGQLFFRACEGPTGCELWKSDGTAAGTVLVKDVRAGPGSGPRGSCRGSRVSTAGCCSRPTTPSTAWSCGPATGRRRGRRF